MLSISVRACLNIYQYVYFDGVFVYFNEKMKNFIITLI